MDTQVEIQNFTVVREVLITDLTIALVLTTFLISPRNLSSFSRPFLTMKCMWYETNIVVMERHVVPLAAS